MLNEDGFSYTQSELRVERESDQGLTSISEGSSDELSDSVVEKGHYRARQAYRKIENRMSYFRKHVSMLHIEQGKIVDPFFTYMIERLEDKHSYAEQIDRANGSQTSKLVAKSPKPSAESTKRSASISGDDYHHGIDKVNKSKETDEKEKQTKLFHSLRMKRLVAVDKLDEYLEVLNKKQQQRMTEEYKETPRSFKYSGPARDGPLFNLREQYRRERKAWRVSYAKKYGIFCRKMRLEKRLMRKAKRLVVREQVLNALKDKSTSKFLLLVDMRNEFKKLVDRLKLNKEIQKKIDRQTRLNVVRKKNIDRKPKKRIVVRHKSIFQTKADIAPQSRKSIVEDAEMQKSPRSDYKTPAKSGFSELTPLPSAPSTTISSGRKSLSKKNPSITRRFSTSKSLTLSATQTNISGPPLARDKKSSPVKTQTAKSARTESTLPSPSSVLKVGTLTVTRARMGKSCHKVLPLIEEMKYGASNIENSQVSSRAARDGHQSASGIQAKSVSTTHSSRPREIVCADKTNKGKCALGQEASSSDWPQQTIMLPGQMVRRSQINPLPRYKYKYGEDETMEIFSSLYKRMLEDQLKTHFGADRSERFIDMFVRDITKMTDYVFDHLHLLPRSEVDSIVTKLMQMKDDERFDVLTQFQLDVGFTSNRAKPGLKRNVLKHICSGVKNELRKTYLKFEENQIKRKKEFKANKSKWARRKRIVDESKVIKKKRKVRTLADKLLLLRSSQFKNSVKVTTKLGGKLMLKGWKPLTHDEYLAVGTPLPIKKTGRRRDGMENYEILAPVAPVDDLRYMIVLNRLDLTPRRFQFPGYKFDSHILPMFKHCSAFYRTHLLKKGDRKSDRGKQRSTYFQTEKANTFARSDLEPGEYRVPHMRHRIFDTTKVVYQLTKPEHKNVPLIFSKRSELVDDDDEDVKKLKILLKETETLDLWAFEGTVALKGTDESISYIKDAKRMNKYGTRYHRTFERCTQTQLLSYTDRYVQVNAPTRDSKKTNVYETDITTPIVEFRVKTERIRRPGLQEDGVLSDSSSNDSGSSVESFPDDNMKILTSPEFATKAKQTLRIMDSLVHSKQQIIFSVGLDLDPLDSKAEVSYSHEMLFSFIDNRLALSEYVVSSMDWSTTNPNVLAVGYSRHPLYPEQDKGMICIWNIKLITKYERKFEFKSSVTNVHFCVPYPRLLNVALLDGSVLILDLGAKKDFIVTTKLSSAFSDFQPVWQFSWLELEKGNFIPVVCGDNGLIHQLRPDGAFQHSKFLSLGHREGKLKGIRMTSSMGLKPRLRGRPGITCLEKHPTDTTSYLVGTRDGCVHICSIHFRNQHLDVFSAHVGAVRGIEFHPDCEHVFLTYGEDFYVRVWLYGTFEPALELMAGHHFVRCARWSPGNAEILVSISEKFINVWDIRRKTESPVHRFMNPREVENTSLIFDRSGRNIVVGTIGGEAFVYALKCMPFTHHFKGIAIANSLEKVLKAKKKFMRDIRKLGSPFGPSNQ